MKGVVNFYKDFGKAMKSNMSKKSPPPLPNVQPPIWQTPGKLQYYRAENEPFIPDDIKWAVRYPTRFAMRQPKLSYLEKVQEEVHNFLKTNIKHDFLKPDRELTLDLTLREAEILASAGEDVKIMAEKGDLRNLHERFRIIKEQVEVDYLKVRDHIDRIIVSIEEKENELYDQAEEMGAKKLHRHGQQRSLYDIFGANYTNPTISNLSAITSHLEGQAVENHEALANIRTKLQSLARVKQQAHNSQAEIIKSYFTRVDSQDQDAQTEHKVHANLRDAIESLLEGAEYEMNEEASTLMSTLQQIVDGDMKNLFATFKEYEKTHEERERVYFHYMNDQTSEYLDTFRSDLLQHLAGSIVIKEHRQRYQKEQYDRFISSLTSRRLKKVNQNLDQFTREYANMIEGLIDESHNNRSPKIEANYDDFAERTVRPLNATIFYYFFSADKRRKTIAQWLLSAIRYPNLKVRKAYMRFFA